MKRLAVVALAVVVGLTLVALAAQAADKKYSGFLGDEYYAKLGPGPDGGVKERWLKPGVNFGQYKRLMVDSIVFFLGDESESKAIDPQEMKELGDACNKAIIDTLKDSYPIVAEPAPDVMRVRIAITNLKQSKAGVSAVTSVLPIGIGLSLIKKGVTGSWSGSGATGAESMFLDSVSNDVIAVAVDEQTAGFTERFSKWGSAEDAFKFWAGRLKAFLDSQAAAK